jgi:hypothetical protein
MHMPWGGGNLRGGKRQLARPRILECECVASVQEAQGTVQCQTLVSTSESCQMSQIEGNLMGRLLTVTHIKLKCKFS